LLGGLARRATFIDQLKSGQPNLLLVDAGDLLFSQPFVEVPNAKSMGDLKADLYLQTYNLMKYDAFTPGEIDLSFGVGNLIPLSQKASFPFLAANLVQTKSLKPVFKSFVIKEVGGLKVGILGLVSHRYLLGDPPEEREKYSLLDPVRVAKRLIPLLKKKCQVIVVLAHMDLSEQETLIQAVPGIHIVVGGHRSPPTNDPIKILDTEAFVAGKRGDHLGKIDFSRDQGKIQFQFQLISLDKQYGDHPQVMEMLSRYKGALQNLLQATAPAEPREPQPRLARPVSSYVGEQSCQSCHPSQYQHWLTTAHARAYDTLVQQGKTSDPNCLACHTTGFGGVKAPNVHFENVQCEACHGPGVGHPETWKNFSPIGESQCLKCHNVANSPNFDYSLYLQKVQHKKE
jgi:hypothetical protein